MNDLKEHIFPYESFIGGWYIPEKLCDDIITYFNNNKNHQKVEKLNPFLTLNSNSKYKSEYK